jgi:hypothetical protein
MVTYSGQGLQNLIHIIFHEVKMMESNQNKYMFRKKKRKFMLYFMDFSFQDCKKKTS